MLNTMRSDKFELIIVVSIVAALVWQLPPMFPHGASRPLFLGPSTVLAQTVDGNLPERIPQIGLITDFGCCGKVGECQPGPRTANWGPFGTRDQLEAKSGERLRITCEEADIPFFLLLYTPPGESEFHVGICPFEGGCNTARFFFLMDEAAGVDKAPDRLSGTFWRSKDYGSNDDETFNSWTKTADPDENLLDWAQLNFNAETQNLDKMSLKWEYRFGPPVFGCPAPSRPEGNLVSETRVDPPIGPESEAFFSEVERSLQVQPPGEAMHEDTSAPCDLNTDGFCNEMDFSFFSRFLDTCTGDPLYNPDADFNGSGCVDALDKYYLYEQDSNRDGVPDLQEPGKSATGSDAR